MTQQHLRIATPQHQAMVEITHEVQRAVTQLRLRNGVIHLFTRHTTCALCINENADPHVVTDLLRRLEALIPWHDPRDRHAEGNSAAHLRTILVGTSESVPVADGRLQLGTWQGIYLCEFDGPRTREVVVDVLGAEKAVKSG